MMTVGKNRRIGKFIKFGSPFCIRVHGGARTGTSLIVYPQANARTVVGSDSRANMGEEGPPAFLTSRMFRLIRPLLVRPHLTHPRWFYRCRYSIDDGEARASAPSRGRS